MVSFWPKVDRAQVEVTEACLRRLEVQVDGANGAVAVLGDDDVGDVGALGLGIIDLVAVDER